MGSMSIWHWAVVLIVVFLLFGRGKVSDVMGDFAKGIRSFKKGLAEDETGSPAATGSVNPDPAKLTPPQPANAAASQESGVR
jgi:sec-independent protein translocase protein TatA